MIAHGFRPVGRLKSCQQNSLALPNRRRRAYHEPFVDGIPPMLSNRLFVVLAAVALLGVSVAAQQRARATREGTVAERTDASTTQQHLLLQATRKLADDSASGRPVVNDLLLAWTRDDLLKAENNEQYVPFTVSLDPSRLGDDRTFAIYWRAVRTAGTGPYAYEYLDTASASDLRLGRLQRSFTVPAGTYDVFVVVRETSVVTTKGAAPVRASAIRHTVTVPDLWNEELNTSSVIIAERIDELPAPLTAQEKIDRPYALKTIEFVPFNGTTFSKNDELSAFLLIYNALVDPASKKPNVNVEFNFYAKVAGGEKFFNRTLPTNLNSETLPPQFDVAAGYQLQAGQAVPLASFPAGDYRLEIRVTDRIARKTLTRGVNFTVAGS